MLAKKRRRHGVKLVRAAPGAAHLSLEGMVAGGSASTTDAREPPATEVVESPDPALVISVVAAEATAVLDEETREAKDNSIGKVSCVLAGEPGSLERSFGTTCHGAGRRLAWLGVRPGASRPYIETRARVQLHRAEWDIEVRKR
jgi:hypothetical protein